MMMMMMTMVVIIRIVVVLLLLLPLHVLLNLLLAMAVGLLGRLLLHQMTEILGGFDCDHFCFGCVGDVDIHSIWCGHHLDGIWCVELVAKRCCCLLFVLSFGPRPFLWGSNRAGVRVELDGNERDYQQCIQYAALKGRVVDIIMPLLSTMLCRTFPCNVA